MANISVYRGSDKGSGPLRFRLSDGRGVCLYWTANFCGDKTKSSIEHCKALIAKAYLNLKNSEASVDSVSLKKEIESAIGADVRHGNLPLAERYRAFVEQGYAAGFIGKGRYAQCLSIASRLERWLSITRRENLPVEDFTADMLLEYRKFVADEYQYAGSYPLLYFGLCRRPRKRRKNSSVVLELKALKAFFSELEDTEEIRRSPFRRLSREKRKSIMHVMYDEPVFLREAEWKAVRDAPVPGEMAWVRDVFVFNCCIGSRIGDVQRLEPDNLDISEDGIPFVHYMPEKTKRRLSTNREIETPLIPIALKIMMKSLPLFCRTKYNFLLKRLLKQCGISRKVRIFNESEGCNDYLPLWQVASSKLARKTHVDMMNKVQLDPWASGLHSPGSNAVFRYTRLELADRYKLLKLAFGG